MKTLNKGYFAEFSDAQEFYLKHQDYITLVNVMINDNAHLYGEWILIYITDGEDNG